MHTYTTTNIDKKNSESQNNLNKLSVILIFNLQVKVL